LQWFAVVDRDSFDSKQLQTIANSFHHALGKMLFILGLVIMAIGAILTWTPGLLSWFGRLPGDIRIEKESSGFHFPIVSMTIVSIALSILHDI